MNYEELEIYANNDFTNAFLKCFVSHNDPHGRRNFFCFEI